MRRSTVRWGLGISFVLVSMSGCASLLGDFTNGTESGGDDGGPGVDGSQNKIEGSVGDDDGGSSDANNDGNSQGDGPNNLDAADSAIPLLTCVEQNGSRTKLGTIARGGGNDGNSVQLFNASVGNDTQFRAYVREQPQSGPSVYHVYSFGGGGSNNNSDIPIPNDNDNGSGPMTVVRYATGIAAMIPATLNDAGVQTPVLEVLKLEDAANAWSAPVIIASGAAVPNCQGSNNERQSGALVVKDAAANDYFFEIAVSGCGGANTSFHSAGHFALGVLTYELWPFPPQVLEVPDGGDAGPVVDAGPAQFSVGGLAVSGTEMFGMTNPGSDGPDPGIGSALFSSSTALTAADVTARELSLVNTNDLMQELAMTTLPSGNIGLAILEANLATQPVTPVVYVGSLPPTSMSALALGDLRATTLPTLSDLPINNATYHWESFGGQLPSDNLLAVGSIFPNSNGLDFIWWDANGNVRAQKTNANAFFYYDPVDAGTSGLTLNGGDVTFNSAPFGAIAGLEMVFVKTDGEASTVSDVWATAVNCAP